MSLNLEGKKEVVAEVSARLKKAQFETLPLKTTLIRVNYANASEMPRPIRPAPTTATRVTIALP